MAETKQTSKQTRVFCSYCKDDRSRVTGLGILLGALGHQVFLDHLTIKPGALWKARIQEGLDQADVLVVYWTKNAAQSEWVKKETKYFHKNYPKRQVVPILGDETPLMPFLEKFQRSDFCPLINELLELKRTMESHGSTQSQIEKQILNRLHEAGIEIQPQDRKKLFLLFTAGGLFGLISTPALMMKSMANRTVEWFSQLTWSQVASLAVAAVSGAFICSVAHNHPVDKDRSVTIETESQLINARPADVWLGMWTLAGGEADSKSDTFFIQRNCDEYGILFKEARILSISKEQLHFMEGPNEFKVNIINNESAKVEVRSPDSATISKHSFTKVVGSPINIKECVE